MNDDALARARGGDADAFRDLIEPYRGGLRLHCYRMLGSLTDAEDVLQETLVAAWRHLPRFEGRASVRSWLYRIATNRCLNARRDRRRRLPAVPVPPFDPPEPTRRGDVTWLEPYPDALLDRAADAAPGPEPRYQAREAIELAFIVGLQHLPPRQAAALVLHDVLAFTTAEVATMLGTTPTAVKGLLQRARASIDRRPSPTGPRPTAAADERDVVRRFADAFSTDDVDAVVALLSDAAWLAMPPAPHEYQGRTAIAGFLRASAGGRAGRRLRLIETRANGQPAFACYLADPGDGVEREAGLVVLTLAGDRIGGITRFLHPAVLGAFGLPPITSCRIQRKEEQVGMARDVAERFYQAFDAGDFDGMRALYTDDCVTVTPVGGLDNDAHEAFGRSFKGGLPDGHMEVTRLVEDGDDVCVIGRFRGTHSGDLVSPNGTIPASGNSLDLPFADYFRISGGKIAAQESIFDQMTLLAQLGVLGR